MSTKTVSKMRYSDIRRKIYQKLMEHLGTDATKVLKVNPAPDGVDDSHIRSERKIQVAKLQIIFRKSLEQQRSHL